MEIEVHNYSSSGPTYETVDTIEVLRQTYSVLECQESSTVQSMTATEDEEHYYRVLESGECEGDHVTGEACDYEVPVSGQIQSQAKMSEEECPTLKN